jgi:glutamyl aminopeptidase
LGIIFRKYSTGTPEALFDSFQREIKSNNISEFNVTKVMNSWTRQSGFPLINVVFKNNTATLTQTRFYLRPTRNETSPNIWMIPINWATRSNPNFNNTEKVVWLDKKLKCIEIKDLKNKDWIIFNLQQTGEL